MTKKNLILCLLYIWAVNAYCIEMRDFAFTSKNKQFSVKSSELEIVKIFNDENPVIEDAYHKNSGYVLYKYDGIEFCFINNEIFSIDITSEDYVVKSGIKVGNNIKKVYEYYSDVFKGKFEDGYDFIDLYYKIPTDSHWKEPQYTLRFIYKDEKISEITVFYTE